MTGDVVAVGLSFEYDNVSITSSSEVTIYTYLEIVLLNISM